MSHNILGLYHQRNINDLCKKNLTEKMDVDGNTILHIIAMNLDHDTLQQINNLIPSQLHGCINTKNNLGESPLHKALDSLNNMNTQDDSIVTFMIKILGADPNIPDNNNRIIIPIEDSLSPSSSLHNDILRLNNDVIQNILELSKLSSSHIKSLHQSSKTEKSINSNALSDQLKNIFGKRSGPDDPSHGKRSGPDDPSHGKRSGPNDYSHGKRSGPNDYSHGKQNIPQTSLDSKSVNKKSSISTYMGNDSSDKLEFIKSLIKLYRSKSSGEETKQQEMYGGLYGGNSLNNLFDDDNDNDYLSMHGGYKGKRKINAYSSDQNDFVVSNPNNMLNMLAMQDRPKIDPEVAAKNNDFYKEILKKIKKNLDLDD